MMFDQMPDRNSVSWGILLAGYAKLGYCVEAIDLFDGMVHLRVNYDNDALVLVLSACAQIGELTKGKKIHYQIERDGIKSDSYLWTGFIDMNAKCGSIGFAKDVFDSCLVKNVSLWNAMPFVLAMHGNDKLLLKYFSRMAKDAIRLDGVTILGVLVGCSHSRLINEARVIFREMESIYDVPLELKHYGSKQIHVK
ncbi:pentatricopeptide repeat-containing protein At5g61800-like [Primulina tabacum]|uniref:pentatricopeptide repeat-containing protein At5g61800-like n=1 Tax=Primulina tabacum TaxID=48773 RepID=UPI003F593FE5